jgi:tetratricopeptide (TPR) repeat protein
MRPYNARKSDEVLVVRRGKFLTLLQTALSNREFQFARQAALIWLASYPGDLLISFIYASVLAELGDTEMAIKNLSKLLAYDPEFMEAASLLDRLTGESNRETHANQLYLQRGVSKGKSPTSWLDGLIAARNAWESGDLTGAEKAILESLAHNPRSPLPAAFHMQIIHKTGNTTLLETLAGIYASRWPDCVQIKVLSAIADIQQGNDSAGVEKMHWCAAHDVSGQVINRLLGPDHNYKPLWPEDLKVYLDLPVPASVAADLGWNVLSNSDFVSSEPAGKEAIPQTAEEIIDDDPTLALNLPDYLVEELAESGDVDYSEIPTSSFFLQDIATPPLPSGHTNEVPALPSSSAGKSVPMSADTEATVKAIIEIQTEFEKVARKINKSELMNTDGRFPSYVILTSRGNLEKKYGANTADVVIESMRKLCLNIVDLPGWNSLVYVPDDEASAREQGLEPIHASDAWKIKLSLTDLDAKLASRGEMIGALLIIGGQDIVPFHMLPNPTDDSDTNVPSDNPYATLDENYFIQQWPVGRIPDEAGTDAGYLLEQIRFLTKEYELKVKSKKSISTNILANLLRSLALHFQAFNLRFQKKDNIGCTAEVWKPASSEVFAIIDRSERLLSSPPTTNSNLLNGQTPDPKFAYFNLHGLKDSPEWYGQRDLAKTSNEPEYPVAMEPANFKPQTSSPEIVLSEACYGANILDKKVDEAISLNFLACGTRAFIGSTCIAYGSVSKSLVAADLLAYHFWTHVKAEVSVGYALMRAKLALAKKMTEDQGYLDGEDQKTILSFVLYGDPLTSSANIKEVSKPAIRPTTTPELKTISDSREELIVAASEMPTEILDKVRKVISSYLPGLDDATVSLNPQLTNFTLDPAMVQAHRQNFDYVSQSQRYVVTLKKSYEYRQHNHNHFARVTFNQKGEMLKLSTSR